MKTHRQTRRQTFRKERMAKLLVMVLIAVVPWPVHGWATELTHEQLYALTAPGVVFVYGRSGSGGSVGSGSIVRADGLVLTNAHVVINEESGSPHDVLWVALKPDDTSGDFGKDLKDRFPATVQAFHQELDLALLQVTTPLPAVTVLNVGDSDHVNVGARVIAIGHPEQGGLWTLTTGVISAFRANHGEVMGKHVFQTEASMNRGNSGGPLIDAEGRQIGVNTSIARQAEDGLTITDVNFSIRSNVAVAWMADEGVTIDVAPRGRESESNDRPVAPEDPPRTASTLPSQRPYRFEEVDRWYTRTEQDLENVADDMRKRIRAKRDRDARKSVDQTRNALTVPSETASASTPKRQSRQETQQMVRSQDQSRAGAPPERSVILSEAKNLRSQDPTHVGAPPEHQLDCRVYDERTLDLTAGLKAGNFLFNFGPEMGLTHRSGIAWKEAAQSIIVRYVELCNRYNAGMVTKAEYNARLERIENVYREARQLQEQMKKATRDRSRSAFDELDRELAKMPGNRPTDLDNKVERLAERVERLAASGAR